METHSYWLYIARSGGVMKATTLPPQLQLSHGPTRNGLIPITITNYEDLFPDYDATYTCHLFCAFIQYRFIDPHHYYYQHKHNGLNKTWQSKRHKLMICLDSEYCHLYLKVPFRLYTYTVQFTLTILDARSFRSCKIHSKMYSVEIPPMSLQPQYKVNEQVRFHSGLNVGTGRISEILANDKVKIIVHGDHQTYAHVVHLSDIHYTQYDYDDGIPGWYVLDLTDRNQAILALTFGNVDVKHLQRHDSLRACIFQYLDEGNDEMYFEDWIPHLSDMVSCCVFTFLVAEDAPYIKCVFDDHGLYKHQHWNFCIRHDIKSDEDRNDLQYEYASCHIACV
eukprot:464465_1